MVVVLERLVVPVFEAMRNVVRGVVGEGEGGK